MVEGTLAGLAAGAVALRVQHVWQSAVRVARRLDILRNGELIDFALIDVVVYDERFVASRAIWDVTKIRTVILSQMKPGTIGASAIAGYLPERPPDSRYGVWLEIGAGDRQVLAPLAPGIMVTAPIASLHWLAVGKQKPIIHTPTVLALDGERELPIKAGEVIEVRLSQNGPQVVDVNAALRVAAQSKLFVSPNKIGGELKEE